MRPLLSMVFTLAATAAFAGAAVENGAAPTNSAAPTGSPGAGESGPSGAALFDQQCGSCHTFDPASSLLAPSLKGVVGRKIAGLPDFDYSPALKAKDGTWTEEALDAFLADPQSYAPGTLMAGSEPDAAARQAIIAYLKTIS